MLFRCFLRSLWVAFAADMSARSSEPHCPMHHIRSMAIHNARIRVKSLTSPSKSIEFQIVEVNPEREAVVVAKVSSSPSQPDLL